MTRGTVPGIRRISAHWMLVCVSCLALPVLAEEPPLVLPDEPPRIQASIAAVVIGHVDGVDAAGVLHGWACATGVNQSIDVHLYVGGGWPTGTFIGSYRADQASEVSSACQTQGTPHRFQIALTEATRQQHGGKTIDIHGVSPVGTGNPLVTNSGATTVPAIAMPMLSLTRQYVYDGARQLCKIIEPETGATVFGHDDAGNVTWSAAGLSLPNTNDCDHVAAWNSGRRVDREYDARNRIIALRFPDGLGDTTFTYTPAGKLASITTDNGGGNVVTQAYAYNGRGLLTQERLQWNGGLQWPIDYAFSANGHLAAQSWNGLTVDYAPNALGQPTQAGHFASNVQYHPNGAIRQFTYGNGIVRTLTQNTRGLPDVNRHAYDGTAYLDDGYDYDANGNVAAISDGLPGARGDRTMAYDGLDRLTAVSSPMFSAARYEYDALDNLKRVTIGGSAGRDHHYCHDGNNRLTNIKSGGCDTSASVVGMGYDLQGNLQNRNGRGYSFDYGNRLRSVEAQGTHPASTYVYDGHGRRVRDTTTGHKYSHYTLDGRLAMTADERQGTVAEYIQLNGALLAIREHDVATGRHVVKYQHNDALGSPVVMTDQHRNVVERLEYEPYGKVINGLAKDGPNYTGHVFDAATGLLYAQQRYLDTDGRFLSVDSITAYETGDWRLFNRYAYGYNNPYRFTDPDGRCPTCLTGGVGAGVGLLVGFGMESYRQYRAGKFDAPALIVEAGKGAIVGGLIGLTGGAAAANGLSLSGQMAATSAVGLGIGAGAHAAGELAKGNSAPSAEESIMAGAATALGAAFGTAIGPGTQSVTTTVVPGVSSHPVTSLSGRVFNTVNMPPEIIEHPTAAQVANNVGAALVEDYAKADSP